jgi:hypothetical protein
MNTDKDAALKAMTQADAVAAISGFEKTEQRKSLDAAMLAGRATTQQVTDLLLLEARLLGARDVLKQLPQDDPRLSTILANFDANLQTLYAKAEAMGGAVRLTLKL